MKKQIINKVLVALLISTMAMPQAYGHEVIPTALVTCLGGTIGGVSAVIGKIISDRIFGNNDQQNNNNDRNITISGMIGGVWGAETATILTLGESTISTIHPIISTIMGMATSYLCNKVYDKFMPNNKRDYNSFKTAFTSGAVTAGSIALLAYITTKPAKLVLAHPFLMAAFAR